MVKYRPLLVVTSEGKTRQFTSKAFVLADDLRQSDKTPLQLRSLDGLDQFLNLYEPVEMHMAVTRFYEQSFKSFVIDLDSSPSMGIGTVFDFAKGFGEYISGKPFVKGVRILFTGNRGFHIHVELVSRASSAEVNSMFASFAAYPHPFIGTLDSNVLRIGHFIRMPFSWNRKGKKFSFYVDKLNEFNSDIAKDFSCKLYSGLTGETCPEL